MPIRFLRFVNGPWVAILGVGLAILGIPGMFEDAVAWSGWLSKLPPVASLALLSIGSLLLLLYLYSIRQQIRDWILKLLEAADTGLAAFWKHFRPPIRAANWSDLYPDQSRVEINRWEILEHTIRKTGLVSGEAYPALVGMAQVKETQGHRSLYM